MFNLGKSLYGTEVLVEKPVPRYVLPDDVPPPKGMTREEFNRWAFDVCGCHPPVIPDGVVYTTSKGYQMNSKTYKQFLARCGN